MEILFDSHVHLADDRLYPEWEAILNRALEGGVKKLLVITTNPIEMRRAFKMQKSYKEHLFVAASITPHEAHTASSEELQEIEEAARGGLLQALGETGLEYFYLKETKEAQLTLLEKTLKLGAELHLPIVFHCREAFEDLFRLLNIYKPKGVLHCFTGTEDEAKGVIERGLYLSFSGILTYPKSESLRTTAKKLPLEQLLIETDAPYLAPQTKRGKTNEPLFVQETLSVLADTLGRSKEDVAHQTYCNGLSLLNLLR